MEFPPTGEDRTSVGHRRLDIGEKILSWSRFGVQKGKVVVIMTTEEKLKVASIAYVRFAEMKLMNSLEMKSSVAGDKALIWTNSGGG